MTITLHEERFAVQPVAGHKGLLTHLRQASARQTPEGLVIRFVVTSTTDSGYQCEFSVISGLAGSGRPPTDSVFEFRHRLKENTEKFNVVLLVPTGVGAEIGGHAGDAGPVAQLLAEVSDTLVLHPNVVNASDINEMPPNALYVEGSVVTRLLMGTVGLQPVRSNRVFVVIDAHEDELFVNAAVNSVNGARATYGLLCPEIVCLVQPVKLRARYSSSGRATGLVEEMESLCAVLEERAGQYDAVALSTVIDVPPEFHQQYFDAGGEMVNPWGGVEAMLTHALSSMYGVPTAHSPMLETRDIANRDPGIVDPRLAAEAVSTTFLQCTLKGLQRSPRIIDDVNAMNRPGVFTASDVSCLVIPDGCLGLPTLAALEQGIPVIAVTENRNLMKNDLSALPWAPGQFHRVGNYWEATGVLVAMRAGIDPASVRRPFAKTLISKFTSPGSELVPERSPIAADARGSDALKKPLVTTEGSPPPV
jgi:hypothetical protein